MKSNKLILVVGVVAVIVLLAYYLVPRTAPVDLGQINSYEQCVEAGYPVMESYPEQCRTPDGRNFTRVISEDEQVFCTADAKMCPDGSYVGRVGPFCEFAPCPGEGR